MKKEKRFAFGKNIYLLESDKDGVKYWLEEASWDCGWYWGFGYVETYTNNRNPEKAKDIDSHQHFDGLFLKNNIFDSFKEMLIDTPLTDKEIWQLLELMKTFYTLKNNAELYHHGGSYITNNVLKDILKNEIGENKINKEIMPKLFEEIYKILTPETESEAE